jgi:hypothetical protein
MTNKEAIKRIKEHIAIHKYRESHAIHIVEALEMAISALQAQDVPDINVGNCPYCHEDSDGFVFPIEKNGHAFVRFGMDGWELSLKADGWHGSAKIRYCPMCGRRLERG